MVESGPVLVGVTYITVLSALSLVVIRPRVGGRRLSAAVGAALGVVALGALGIVGPTEAVDAVTDLWRPLLTIGAIMVMTEAAQRVGLVDHLAGSIEHFTKTTVGLFTATFCVSALTATLLNNDAAILLLTPLVVVLVRRRYSARPELIAPFAFAVFGAAGVAPFPTANPMNLVVADFAQIGFNTYARIMVPITVAVWVVSYGVLRMAFRQALAQPLVTEARPRQPTTRFQVTIMLTLVVVLVMYAISSGLRGPLWAVACGGAVVCAGIAWSAGHSPHQTVLQGVSWDTLGFLTGVLVLALGLRNVGLVDHLVGLYVDASSARVGVVSAVGSAVLNNHPMAYLNMLALNDAGLGTEGYLAALVGGDLGPRLLPIGSLAGLLWLECLRRYQVHVGLKTFVGIGVAMTVPSLGVALLILKGLTG
jgi:arsenical pump membrane protein